MKFLNKSKDIQDSYCLGLEDNSLSKHFGFKITIPDLIEPHYIHGSRHSQKKLINVKRDVIDDCTKPDGPPDRSTETTWDSLPMYDYNWSTESMVVSSLGFTRECNDTAKMTLQDWAVGTSDGTSNKESQMKELTLKENHVHKEPCEFPTGKGDRIRMMGDLPLTGFWI